MLRHHFIFNFCQKIGRRSLTTEAPKSTELGTNITEKSAKGTDSPSGSYCSGNAEKSPTLTYTEVEVPVPWGHIAGKWWGSEDQIPVIGLHGFEDNAGTYDRLVPLLDIPAFFAWDAPGHGRSSHMPFGHTYHFVDFLISLRLLVRRYGWEKVSFIGHSWGSVLALMYSALYPNSVERYVSLDCARSLMPNVGVLGVDRLRSIVNHMMKCDKIIDGRKQPRSYQVRDARTLIVQGTFDSVNAENCDPLLERGTLPHPTVPDTIYFSRDHRLRGGDTCRPTNELVTQAAGQIRCHVMTMLAKQGFVYMVGDDVKSHYQQQEGIMEQNAASYQARVVKGTHHVHLNNPERVAPLINKFFNVELE